MLTWSKTRELRNFNRHINSEVKMASNDNTNNTNDSDEGEVEVNNPVSYTHLDVYKRQILSSWF